jgi:hypothetical protein
MWIFLVARCSQACGQFQGVGGSENRQGWYFFLSDNWLINEDSKSMKERFPRLHSYVLDENMWPTQVYSCEDILSLFDLSLSNLAHQVLLVLQGMIEDNIQVNQTDGWSYCWGEQYRATKFYKHIHSHIQVPSVYKWLWKSSCIMQTKVFVWLLLLDRLNTRDMLQRRHWWVTDDAHYELCTLRIYEDTSHMFYECNFSARL